MVDKIASEVSSEAIFQYLDGGGNVTAGDWQSVIVFEENVDRVPVPLSLFPPLLRCSDE